MKVNLPSVTLELKWNKSRGTSRGESHWWKVERAAINIAFLAAKKFTPQGFNKKVSTLDIMWNRPGYQEAIRRIAGSVIITTNNGLR